MGTRNCTRVEQHDKPQIVQVFLPIEIIIRDLEGSSCIQSPQCITSYLIYENITSYMYSSQNVHHEHAYTITCEPPYVMHPCNVPMHSSCSSVSLANSNSPSVHMYMLVYTYRCIYICVCLLYMYIYVTADICIYIYIIYDHMHIYKHIHVYIYMYMCIYIHMSIRIYV